MTTCSPFLRWAGGKRQLLPALAAALPADFDLSNNRFFEPFVGGGAFMFALRSHVASAALPEKAVPRKRGRPVVINDANEELATTYAVLQTDVEELIEALAELSKDVSKDRYMTVRAHQPTDAVARAARTIYLNKLNFNGLYRVNAGGGFNVPYGNLASPTVCNPELLRACSEWLAHVEVRSGHYAAALADAKGGDVVYLDPPYIPLSKTAGFSKYAKDDFLELDQYGLAGVINGLTARGVRVIFSNSNAALTRTIYSPHLHLFAVSASRSIGASKESRARVEEVLGTNFEPSTCADPSVLAGLRKLATGYRLLTH